MFSKRTRALVLSIIMVVILASLALSCGTEDSTPAPGPGPAPEPGKVYELSFALFQPEAAPVSKANTAFARALEERTNGQLKITVHQSGSLLGAPAMYQGIIDGITDMGNGITSYDPGAFPLTYSIEVPVGGDSGWSLSAAANDFMRKYEPEEWDEVKVLTTVMTGAGLSVSGTGKEPVRTLEDMKGKTMRTNSVEFTEALGATVQDMPMSAVYDAISKGVIDGCVTSLEPLGAGWKLGDVMKYVTLFLHPDQPTVMWYNSMNIDKWNSLPADLQKIILDTSAEQSREIGLVWDNQMVAGLEYAISVGSEIYVLPPDEEARWAAAVAPVTEYQLGLAASKGGLPRSYIDEVYNYMLDRVQYWNGQQGANNIRATFDRVKEVLK